MEAFAMKVMDMFVLADRGVVLTGEVITHCQLDPGEFVTYRGTTYKVLGIERFSMNLGKPMKRAERVGIMIKRDVNLDDVYPGELMELADGE